MNLTATLIAELMSTETGRAALMVRVERAKFEIDSIAIRARGITLVGNMAAWDPIEAIPILVLGINRNESETKERWRPYND